MARTDGARSGAKRNFRRRQAKAKMAASIGAPLRLDDVDISKRRRLGKVRVSCNAVATTHRHVFEVRGVAGII